jgi:hypothetical protein
VSTQVSRLRQSLALAIGLCCLTLLAGWWTKARCLDGGWTDGEEFAGWCYTDVYALYFADRIGEGAVPYLDAPVEYPVLTGAQMWLTGLVADTPAGYYHATAWTGAALLLGALLLLDRAGAARERLLWFSLSPTLAVYAFMNWDALPVALLLAAVVLHRRDRDGLAGVAAGLGAAAKLFPAVLVPLIVAARLAQGRRRAALAHGLAAGGAWLAVNVPVLVAAPDGWALFLQLNRDRPADWDSLWFAVEQLRGAGLDVAALNRASATLFLVGATAIAALGARLSPPEDWWRLALPLLCWFLLTNKVYSPQFSLWLLPLMALALPRAAPFAAFAVADLMVFAVRFPFLGGQIGLAPAPGYGVFAFAVLVRAAVLLWVIAASLNAAAPDAGRRSAAGHASGKAAGSGDDVADPLPAGRFGRLGGRLQRLGRRRRGRGRGRGRGRDRGRGDLRLLPGRALAGLRRGGGLGLLARRL